MSVRQREQEWNESELLQRIIDEYIYSYFV